MNGNTAALARSITWAGSKQTYYTIRVLVDRGRVDDCYRAYAYFRWADDVVDLSSTSAEQRVAFIRRQRELIDRLYQGERQGDLIPEEALIADLIGNDSGRNTGLHSFIYNFLAVLEFDAQRRGRLVNQQELTWYSNCLGRAVVDCIQYFIGHGHPYPMTKDRYMASTAAHVAHMLRDMLPDMADGFINVPREILELHAIDHGDVQAPAFRAWVQQRVKLAREYFHDGKRYLDRLDVLRCKLAGTWYCARYDGLLDAIEREGYILRDTYSERHRFSTIVRLLWVGVSVTLKHIGQMGLAGLAGRAKSGSDMRQRT